MNILRDIIKFKLIALVALSSLFMISMESTPAQAFGRCPCNFFSTLPYYEEIADEFDADLDLCVNIDDNGTIEIIAENSECQKTILKLGEDGEDEEVYCYSKVSCNEPGDFVTSEQQFSGLDDDEEDSCERQLRLWIWIKDIPDCDD